MRQLILKIFIAVLQPARVSIFLTFMSVFVPFNANGEGVCSAILEVERYLAERPVTAKVKELIDKVIADYKKQNLPILRFFSNDRESNTLEGDELFEAWKQKSQINLPQYSTLPRPWGWKLILKREGGMDGHYIWQAGTTATDVIRVRLMPYGETKFFRPFEQRRTAVIRRTLAAFIASQKMKLNFVPYTEIAVVNGQLGLLSDKARGFNGAGFISFPIGTLLAENAYGFAFLIGDKDASWANTMVNMWGTKIKFFDGSEAFEPGLVKQPGLSYGYFGYDVPQRYTKGFVEALLDWSPEQMRIDFQGILTTDEVDALIFRRAILLLDAKEKGLS